MTNPPTDEMVELACRAYYNSGVPVHPPVFEGMRAALVSALAVLPASDGLATGWFEGTEDADGNELVTVRADDPRLAVASGVTNVIAWMIRDDTGETYIDENCLWLTQADAIEAAALMDDPDHTYTAFVVVAA